MAGSVAASAENSTKKIYLTVIDEVITNVRETFLDEGYDEQLLQELRHLWEQKLNASRAIQAADEENGSSSGIRLPITHPASSGLSGKQHKGVSSHHSAAARDQSASNVVDVKPDINASTLDALKALPPQMKKPLAQLDGDAGGSSSEEDDDEDDIVAEIGDDDDDVDDKATHDENEYEGKEDPDPLNSGDDLTDSDSDQSNSDLFDTDHVIVCQYDKITRIKNRWKFHLKDGIMNINGKDYLFSKATGDAEW